MNTNKVISAPDISHHFRCRRQGDVCSGMTGNRPPAASGAGSTLHMKRCGDPGAIRTHDPQIRNLMLYPAELRGHKIGRGKPEQIRPRSETYVSACIAAIAGMHFPRVSGLFSAMFCAGASARAGRAAPLARGGWQRLPQGETKRRTFIVFRPLRQSGNNFKPLALRSKVDVSCANRVRACIGCRVINDPQSVSAAYCNRGRVPCAYL